MIVRALDARRGTFDLVNPQDGARSTLTLAQLEREWSGRRADDLGAAKNRASPPAMRPKRCAGWPRRKRRPTRGLRRSLPRRRRRKLKTPRRA